MERKQSVARRYRFGIMTNRTAHSLRPPVTIAALGPEHLSGAVALSRQAGWPHRLEDWELVLWLSRGFGALANGRLVGTALATLYGDDVATINMVIVDESLRGQGVGRRLMAAALDAAAGGEQRLIATKDGLPLYEKLGFQATGQIWQHQGLTSSFAPGEDVVQWLHAGSDLDRVAACDRAACGMDRSLLLSVLAAAGSLAVLRDGDVVLGFAGLRAFGRGEVVGPVVASSQDAARSLVAAAFARKGAGLVRVDTPDPELGAWLASLGLPVVGGGVTMVRHARPRRATPFQTFALASQALG